jgi:hypothetical protein
MAIPTCTHPSSPRSWLCPPEPTHPAPGHGYAHLYPPIQLQVKAVPTLLEMKSQVITLSFAEMESQAMAVLTLPEIASRVMAVPTYLEAMEIPALLEMKSQVMALLTLLEMEARVMAMVLLLLSMFM